MNPLTARRHFVVAAVLALAVAAPRLAHADTIAGPALPNTINGWPNSGPQFTATVAARLTTVRVENQGSADTATLYDVTDAAAVLTVNVPAGAPMHVATFDSNLVAGHTYRLTLAGGANGKWNFYTTYPTNGAEISVINLWGNGSPNTSYWFTFTQITTIPCDVDGDTYLGAACGGPDCDDNNAAINPGAPETCNGIDDNCSGAPDEGSDTDCLAEVPARPHCATLAAGGFDAGMDAGEPRPFCVPCASDSHCTGALKACAASFTCVECTATNVTPCAASANGHACVTGDKCGCTTNADCAAGSTCNVGEQTCVPVAPDAGVKDAGKDGSGGGDGGGGGGGGGGGDGGGPFDDGGAGVPAADDGSCGCYTAGASGASSLAGVAIGALALAALRRRRSRR